MSVGGWSEVMRVVMESEKLLEDTLACNEESVAEGLDRAHMEISSILTYNDENSLGCAIGLAYYSARKDYMLIRELPTGHRLCRCCISAASTHRKTGTCH